MASNNTTSIQFSPSAYYMYIGQGSVLFMSNGLILGAILKHWVLRTKNEYLVLAALALVDFCQACGLIIGGLYRMRLIRKGTASTLVTSWDCLLTAHNLIWIWTPQAQDYMLLGVTLDRLFMILIPLEYGGWGLGYIYKMFGIIFSSVGAIGIGAIIVSFNQPRVAKYPAICFTSWAIGDPNYNTFRDTLQAIALFSSVALYPLIPIIYAYHNRVNKVRPEPISRKKGTQGFNRSGYQATKGKRIQGRQRMTNGKSTKENIRNQKRLLVTVGVCVLCTLCFDAIPKLSRVWMHTSDTARQMYSFLVPFNVYLHNMNSFANLFIYFIRHKDIRIGIIYFLKGKDIPPNLF